MWRGDILRTVSEDRQLWTLSTRVSWRSAGPTLTPSSPLRVAFAVGSESCTTLGLSPKEKTQLSLAGDNASESFVCFSVREEKL